MKLDLDQVWIRTKEINTKVDGMQGQVTVLNTTLARMEVLLLEKHPLAKLMKGRTRRKPLMVAKMLKPLP